MTGRDDGRLRQLRRSTARVSAPQRTRTAARAPAVRVAGQFDPRDSVCSALGDPDRLALAGRDAVRLAARPGQRQLADNQPARLLYAALGYQEEDIRLTKAIPPGPRRRR